MDRLTSLVQRLGVGVLCKQFAILALPAIVLVAPNWRKRMSVVVSCFALCLVAVAPFWLAHRVDTWRALSGTYVESAGIIKSATVVGLLGIGEPLKLHIARDAPLAMSLALTIFVWWRAKKRLATWVVITRYGTLGTASFLRPGWVATALFVVSVGPIFLGLWRDGHTIDEKPDRVSVTRVVSSE
jgi:hypothetical protein